MTQVVLADMTSLRYRGLATGLVAMPYVIKQVLSFSLLLKIKY